MMTKDGRNEIERKHGVHSLAWGCDFCKLLNHADEMDAALKLEQELGDALADALLREKIGRGVDSDAVLARHAEMRRARG